MVSSALDLPRIVVSDTPGGRTAMMLPFKMPIVDLRATARELGESGGQVKVLWREDESLAFVARVRDYRSEFHINPSDELMYQISGTMRLHYRTPDGKEAVAAVSEGSIISTAAGTPPA